MNIDGLIIFRDRDRGVSEFLLRNAIHYDYKGFHHDGGQACTDDKPVLRRPVHVSRERLSCSSLPVHPRREGGLLVSEVDLKCEQFKPVR